MRLRPRGGLVPCIRTTPVMASIVLLSHDACCRVSRHESVVPLILDLSGGAVAVAVGGSHLHCKLSFCRLEPFAIAKAWWHTMLLSWIEFCAVR